MKTRTLFIAAIFSLTGTVASVQAENQVVDGYHVRYASYPVHQGLYISLSPGFGGGDFKYTNYSAGSTLEMSGGTSNIDIKIGGALNPNLILSGDFIGSSMLWPHTTVGNLDYGRTNSELRQGLLGLGLTYYFTPSNVFLSGTLGVGGFSISTRDSYEGSDRGLGFQFKVGKEWWVSPQWGIGVSMFILNQHVIESGDRDLNGGSLGFLLNTSFN